MRSDSARPFPGNTIGFRLYRKLDQAGNRLLSPVSITSCLAMLLAGARGETAREIAAGLGIGESEAGRISEAMRLVSRRRGKEWEWRDEARAPVEVEVDLFLLRIANALFVKESYPILDPFRDLLREQFEAELVRIDFARPEPAASKINRWAEEKTEGRITELIGPDSIDESTRMVPVNTVYFLAQWMDQFSEGMTRPKPFYPDGPKGGAVDVPTMHRAGDYRWMSDERLGVEAISIPYRAISMLVLLPENGRIDAVEEALDDGLIEWMTSRMSSRLIELALPRFEIESKWRMAELLASLEVGRAFDRSTADFSGITLDPDGLFVSEVIHQANISVDEMGTEAAAATAMMVLAAGAMEEELKPYPFIIDRPFHFLIRDDESRAILFLGRVTNPLE